MIQNILTFISLATALTKMLPELLKLIKEGQILVEEVTEIWQSMFEQKRAGEAKLAVGPAQQMVSAVTAPVPIIHSAPLAPSTHSAPISPSTRHVISSPETGAPMYVDAPVPVAIVNSRPVGYIDTDKPLPPSYVAETEKEKCDVAESAQNDIIESDDFQRIKEGR